MLDSKTDGRDDITESNWEEEVTLSHSPLLDYLPTGITHGQEDSLYQPIPLPTEPLLP
jgi:hypothetical protein